MENWISKSFEPCQPARTAQADMGRYFFYKCSILWPPPFFFTDHISNVFIRIMGYNPPNRFFFEVISAFGYEKPRHLMLITVNLNFLPQWTNILGIEILTIQSSSFITSYHFSPLIRPWNLKCRGQYTYPCFHGVLLTTNSTKYSFKDAGCFPTETSSSKQWTAVRDRNEFCRNDYHQSSEWILAEPEVRISDLLFSSLSRYRLT